MSDKKSPLKCQDIFFIKQIFPKKINQVLIQFPLDG